MQINFFLFYKNQIIFQNLRTHYSNSKINALMSKGFKTITPYFA